MNAWLMPACRLLAPEVRTVFGIACAVLALLLLTVIAIGFGPLRTWIGLGRAHVPPGLSASEESGLLATWRLYRRLGRNHPTTAGFLRLVYQLSSYLSQWKEVRWVNGRRQI
jgi:hypothetical protein